MSTTRFTSSTYALLKYGHLYSFFLILSLFSFSGRGQEIRRTYTFENPNGVYAIPNHETSTFKQEVERISDTETIVRVTISEGFQAVSSPYPLSAIPDSLLRYTVPTSHVQSDAPEIVELVQQVKEAANYENQWHMVSSVLSWSRGMLRYGNPSEIPTALDAVRDRTVNCIGFVHLPAAMLRNLGIPARVVRTFMVRGSGLTRHYLLEVYFPEDEIWVTFEPQTLRPPMTGNVAVFVDNNWNQGKHVTSRNFSIDPETFVRHGLPYQTETVDEISQLPRPDWDSFTNQKCMGLSVASNGEDFSVLAYGSPQPGPVMSSKSQYEDLELIFYTPTDSGYDMQIVIPTDYAEGEFTDRGWTGGNWSDNRFVIAGTWGTATNFPRPNPIVKSVLKDNWAVLRFAQLLKEPDENSPAPRAPFGNRQLSGTMMHRGMLMIFKKSDSGAWEHVQNIFNPYVGETVHFGDEIEIVGDRMYVSAANTGVAASQSGEVLKYQLGGDRLWHFTGALLSDKQVHESDRRDQGRFYPHLRFGHKIAADEHKLVIADAEGLHFYDVDGDNLVKQDYVVFDFGTPDVEFPHYRTIEDAIQRQELQALGADSIITSLSLDGNRIPAGFGNMHSGAQKRGAVIIFEHDDGAWMQTARFTPEEIQEYHQFGHNVILRGNQLLASAHHMGTSLGTRSGGIYVFELLEDDLWVSTALLRAANVIDNPMNYQPTGKGAENVGYDMALHQDYVLASAPGLFNRQHPTRNFGAVYQFPVPPRKSELRKSDAPAEAITQSRIRSVEPNPAFSVSQVQIDISEQGPVKLYLRDKSERRIETFIQADELEPGRYTLGQDLSGIEPGNYELVLEAGAQRESFDFLRVSRHNTESIE